MSEPMEREQLEERLAFIERGLEEVTRQLVDSIEELHEARLERDHALERCADRDAVDQARTRIAGELSAVLADRDTIRGEFEAVVEDRAAIRDELEADRDTILGELEAVIEDRAAVRDALEAELSATRASLEETLDALERLRAHPVVRVLRAISRGRAGGDTAS